VLGRVSRSVRKARKSARRAISKFPNIIGEVNANELLIISAQAAERDIESKSFDSDSFGEDKFTTTPFLEGVSQTLGHQEKLVPQRHVEAILEDEAEIKVLEASISGPALRQEVLDKSLSLAQTRLAHEVSVLNGEVPGKDGLDWSGELPDVSTPSKHRWRLTRKLLTLIVVSCADIGVLWYSLFNIPGFGYIEAFLFTAPAVGIQIVFPHLIGSKLGSLSKGPFRSRVRQEEPSSSEPEKKSLLRRTANVVKSAVKWFFSRARRRIVDLAIFSILLTLWLTFINAVTLVRMDYIREMANEEDGLNEIQELALASFSSLTLVGLGLWLVILAYKENPHATEYSSQQQSIYVIQKKLTKARFVTRTIEARIEVLRSDIEYQNQVWAAKPEQYQQEDLMARGVYLRNFVNGAGEPVFTKWVLPDAPFKEKAPHERE
jgi:hypothetical protein